MTRPIVIPQPSPPGRTLWVSAAAIAISLHLAFAAVAYVHLQPDPDSDDLGAPGIEIGLELMSPQKPATDAPPGPGTEAAVASQAMNEQTANPKDADLPKDAPIEAENPDRLVAIDKNVKPEEEKTDAKVKTKASEESVAQEATAMPSLQDAKEAPKSVTVDQGTGESRMRARVTWQKELMAHLDKYKKYPSNRDHTAARIVLLLELDRTGRVLSVDIVEKSGDEAFDEAARMAVMRASPVPAPPPLVADESLSFTLPVNFGAGRKRK